MATAGPTITSATRHPSDPTILQVTYTVPVSGVTRVQLWEKGPTGAPVRIVDTTTLNGNISVHSRYAANVPVSLHMTLTHTTEGASNAGSSVNVAAFKVATPTLVSAVRASATQATLTYSGLTVGFGARGYVYRSAPGGNPVQVDAFDITVSSGSRNAPAPSGTAAYEYEIRVGQHGVLSAASARRSVEKWYQAPPAPTSFNVTRNASTGTVTGTWGAPSVTSRNRWTGVRVFRALKGRPLAAWRTLAAGARSFTDTTTVLSSAYDYGIESFNEAGPSSSRPTASTDSVRERPNAASGLTVTHLGGNRYQLSWTTNATTERPITNQKILARVPGQTATTTLATVSGSVTSHVVTLAANRIYELAVLPTNSVGDAASTSNWTDPVVSIPTNTASLSASWVDASTARVQWSRTSSIGDALEIQFSTEAAPDRNNPAHWFPLASITNWQTAWQTPHTGASQLVPHTYRARAVHTASGQMSAWIYSARLDGQAAPLAPTMGMPWRVDATTPIPLSMRHNPVDGTAQTAGEIRYRLQGSPTWIVQTLGTGAEYDLPAGTYVNGGWLEVQGRTAGATGVYGPWSDTLLVPLRARPTVTITSPPAGVLESQTLTMEWESSDQASALLELWDDTGGNLQLLETVTVGPDVRSHTWDTVLPDGREILSEIVVRDAWQQGESQQVAVTVEYNLPAPPELSAEVILEDASVLLQATPRSGLRTTRTNILANGMDWRRRGSPNRSADRATLTNPDTGEQVEAVHLDFAPTDVVFDTRDAWYPVGAGEVLQFVGEFTRMQDAGSDFVNIQLAHQDHSEMPSAGTGSVTDVPVWPATTTGFHTLSPGGNMYRVRLASLGGVADFHLVRSGIHILPVGGGGGTWLFDGDTVRDGYVYGWNPDGSSYEAIPDDAGDRDVAETVRIEIWCSDTGLPGSWVRCGDTGAQWDHHDRHPRIGVPLWYKARAVAASGAWAESAPVQVVVNSRDTFVHFGPDHAAFVTAGRLVDALTIDGGGLDVESIQYEGHDSWTHHTSSVPLAESISTDLQLLPARGASSLQDWAHALRHRDIIYREPGGIVMRGAPSMGPRRPSSRFVQRLSLTVAGEML